MKKIPVDVRVDFLKNGVIIPILYRDVDGLTHYIRGVEKIEKKYVNKNESIVYHCNTVNDKIKLELIEDLWYYILS